MFREAFRVKNATPKIAPQSLTGDLRPFRHRLQAKQTLAERAFLMSEIVKLIALLLILTKDSLKLKHTIAVWRDEARQTKLTVRQLLAHIFAISLAAATLVFYGAELPNHVAVLTA